MKPLNRPMFRYGGPIKEGVMSGIKEPRANGGSMSQLVQPSSTGMRPGYKGKSKLLSFIPGFSQVAQSTKGIIPRIFNKIKPTFRKQPGVVTGGDPSIRAKYISQTMPKVPFKDKAIAFAKENPYITGFGAPFVVSGGITAAPPVVKTGANLLESTVKQAGDLLVPDFIFDQDQYFKDKEQAKINEDVKKSTATANEKRIKELEALLATDTSANQGKTQDEIRQERIQKYRDIMDIKGMNKTAAYDSLIAASAAVNEAGGDLKGAIKDGSLINKLYSQLVKHLTNLRKLKMPLIHLYLKVRLKQTSLQANQAHT
jgi:hypothetical protein